MSTIRVMAFYALASSMLFTASCQRSSQDSWEDTKTCSRHMTRGLRCLGGKNGDSRAINCREEFLGQEYYSGNYSVGEDFIALPDQNYDDGIAMGDYAARQPMESPGDPGSSIPGIEAFRDPSSNPRWANIYRNVHFEYNSNQVKGQENLSIIHDIANNMRQNPNIYIFVEGHADERGPEAYNLALGSRRCNAVRNMLIQEGVSPDNIFTISYGKERPLVFDHNDECWAINRRAEFKVYQR